MLVASGASGIILSQHQIDLVRVLPYIGAIGIMDLAEQPGDRFDFGGPGERITCLAFEALDDDERPFDLVALPIGEPQRPIALFGDVGFVNPGIVFLARQLFNGIGQCRCTGMRSIGSEPDAGERRLSIRELLLARCWNCRVGSSLRIVATLGSW